MLHTINLLKYFLLSFLLLLVAACGSSSSDDDSEQPSYFRFYNASLNAGAQEVYLGDVDDSVDPSSIGKIAFADVSSIIALEVGNYDLSIMRDAVSEENEQVSMFEQVITMESSMQSLHIMLGDAAAPELIDFIYDATTIDDLDVDDAQMELYVANFSTAYAELDIYISNEDESFQEAQQITSLQYKSFSDLQTMDQQNYVVYLTQTGSDEVVFESIPIALDYMQTYILAIRDDAGIRGIAIDRISNSSIVYSYADEETGARLRFYQSNNSPENIDIYLNGTDSTPTLANLQLGTLSENVSLTSDTYTVTTTETGNLNNINLANLLLGIEEDDSKTLLMYPDPDADPNSADAHQGLVIEQQTRRLAFENTITVVNIGAEDQSIDLYFITADETLNSTERYVKSLDYSDSAELTLLNQQYQIFVTTEDNNENLRSLFESEILTLDANENYLLILEPDANSFSGFSLQIVKE